MKPMLKEIILSMIADNPASCRELAKQIETSTGGMYLGSSVRCCMCRLMKSGLVVRVGTDERGGAKFGLPPQAGTVVSEFQRLLAPLRQGRGV